ncbi:MAG: vWA domain-containing protein, partial [Terriglobales bacterium]
MNHTRRRKNTKRQQGQTLPLMAVMILVLILMVGMAVDMGFAMVTKAALSKACDAAALAAIRNYPLGTSTAQTIAANSFTANYNQPARSAAPVVTMGWSSDAANNTYFSVSASAQINTFFIKVLPQWATMTISANAQTVRAHVVMGLALDRSGSMNLNGGAAALPGAVTDFVGFFDNTLDQVEEASFSSGAHEDVPMGHNFQTPIINSVNSMVFGGGTWSHGGLLDTHNAINSVTIPAGQNTAKVVVFFTDGRANMNQDGILCPGFTVYNSGGCSPAERGAPYNCTAVYFWIGPSPPTANCTDTPSTTSSLLGCGWVG